MQEPPAPEIAFEVRLRSRRNAGAGMVVVGLDPPPDAAASYASPGQYVWLGAWFVLASSPARAPWEVVLRPAGEAAIALATAPIGTMIGSAGPFGDGFPMPRGAPLVMAATGGAIAAARAVMVERLDRDEMKTTHLFLGVASPEEIPLQDEVERWRAAGADVVVCASSEGRRVQDAAAELDVPAGTTLLLVGHAAMIEAMQSLAEKKRLAAYVNY
jgi:NAD(P)H-flavin reductase